MPEKKEVKTVELWDGKAVAIANEHLLKDYDYIVDMNKASNNNDIETLISMTFALLEDGQNVFDEVREHIIKEKGFFDAEELMAVVKKIQAAFPKAASPAQKRW